MKTALSLHHKKCENEISGRLYRGAVEASQRLDYHLRCVSNFSELFAPEVASLRMRLKDYCERLMFTDPVEYGKKAEDLLWRKVFYDFFQKSKQTGKKLLENTFQKQEFKAQLLAGIGCYNHLLLRLQTEFHLDLNGKVDVPFLWQQRGVKKERWKKYQQSAEVDDNVQEWASAASHRMLVYLGDLARYIRDLYEPDFEHSGHIAQRYYLQAFCLNPNNGTPHNQMGSLSCLPFNAAYNYMRCILSHDKFDGAEGNLIRVFHHNNAILSELNNLEGSPTGTVKNAVFLLKFLKLCEIFFLAKQEESQTLCQDALHDFDNILLSEDCQFVEVVEKEKILSFDGDVVFKVAVMCMMCINRLDDKGSSDISTATAFTLALFSHIVHHSTKRLVLSLFERKKNSPKNSDEDIADEISSSLLSFVDITNNKILDADSGKGYVTKKMPAKKIGLKKMPSNHLRMLRRRRKISNTSQDDSELSEGETMELPESDEEICLANSDVSQTGSCSSESLSEHEEEELFVVEQNKIRNASEGNVECADDTSRIDSLVQAKENFAEKDCDALINAVNYDFENFDTPVNGFICEEISLSNETILQFMKKIDLLPSLKILTDWLKTRHDVLSVGAESSHYLISYLVRLLNILLKIEKKFLNANESTYSCFHGLQRNNLEWKQSYPLPEDTQLQHFVPLEKVHCHMAFDVLNRRCLSSLEQMFLRIQCLLSFGSCLPEVTNSLITFDAKENIFFVNEKVKEPICVTPNNEDIIKDDGSQKQQLMRSMTHLWLKAQANDLELKLLVGGSSVQQWSPYVVVDTSVIVNHLHVLKQLNATKRFIIVIPKIVIANLDRLKKERICAREAIRWLEAELNKSTRHIRNQRSSESLSLVPMKYPKKKDKESWDFFQILECCHFFSNPKKTQNESSSPPVTLVIGCPSNLPGNANALSKSVGVSMENVESFYIKLRNSSKNPG